MSVQAVWNKNGVLIMDTLRHDKVVLENSCQCALRFVDLGFELQDSLKEFVITKQLMRRTTAIGTLTEEAQQAELKAGSIHKLPIADKEAHPISLINTSMTRS